MKSRFPVATPSFRLAALSLSLALGGCTSVGSLFSTDKVDYKSAATKTRPLEVPPDLSQLSRDGRYQPQGGVVTASGTAAAAAVGAGAAGAAPAVAVPSVALASRGEMRIERAGQQRWLVVPQTPEQLWPQLKAFWEQRGFTLAIDEPQVGVLETTWAENRAKLPNDVIRNTIGRVLGSLYDTGERDLFRTRVERTPAGSEIYISHRGLEEVYTSERKDNTTWRARPADPQLEAEFLGRLMVALGAREEPARLAAAVASTPEGTPRARALPNQPAATLEVDETFDRAWRRVGLALDRGGFTVEDRDRAGGLYYVRYVDPKTAGKEEPGFFSRLLGGGRGPTSTPVRYRIALKAADTKTQVAVLTSAGGNDTGENGQAIVALLLRELR